MSDAWRRFFVDDGARPVRLELRAPVLHVRHEDLECAWSHPGQGGPDAQSPTRPLMTDLRELDAVNGGAAKLSAALNAGLARETELAAVVVDSGCVPASIGDDVPRIMREASNPRGIPLIFSDCASGRDADVGRLLFDRIRAEPGFGRGRKSPGSVNLVGFPEGPALGELAALLERSGVAVNACALPALTPEQARLLPAAEAQIFMPDAAHEPLYREVFGSWGAPGHAFEPPYGVEGTRRWLMSVAGLFGREAAAEKAFASELAPWARRWDALRARAAGLKLAFVVDRAELPRLKDPRRMRGVPVLALLREMGVRAEVLLHRGAPRGPVKGFKTEAELGRLLRAGGYDAVYTEYPFDERPVRAGAAAFTLAPFEPGVRGAAASLERLLALGRWGFYRRYAPYLQGGRR